MSLRFSNLARPATQSRTHQDRKFRDGGLAWFCGAGAVLSIVLIVSAANATPASGPAGSIQAVAERVNASFRNMEPIPRELLAEVVEVRHLPPIEADPERVTREQLGTSDLAALKKALPDLAFQVLWSKTTTTGFSTALAIKGTRTNGEPFSSKIIMNFNVSHGLITSFDAKQKPEERNLLEQIEHEGGFKTQP